MKTEMLEKRQREILENEEKRKEKQYCICVCASIYIIAFALFMLIRQVSWINDVLWNIFPGATLPIILLLIATAAAILLGGSKGAGGWNHNRKLMRKKVREGLRQLLRKELTDTQYQYFYKSPSNPGIGSNIIEEQR